MRTEGSGLMPDFKKSTLREYFESIVIAVILALFIRTFVVQAFKIPTGSMEDNLKVGDHIIVNEIAIEAPEFNYETKIIASNVADLLKNIEATMGGGKDAAPQATTKSGKPIKFAVKKFRLTNGKVHLGLAGTGMTLPMPDIELTDLGTKEGGITPDQLVLAVMKSVTSSIVSATAKAAGDIGKTGGAAAAEGAKKAVEGLKGLFGGDKKKTP